MASSRKVAVVTGSNKGIGYAIVRALCKQYDGDVILTSRDEGRGQEALKSLQGEGLNPKFHQLDIDDAASVERLRDFLTQQYGGLDVLVNNAGIAFKASATESFAVQAVVTLKTNFWSTLKACDILFPILKPHARVSHVSSFVSIMSLGKCSDAVKAQLTSDKLSIEELKGIMEKFTQTAQEGKHQEAGFSNSAYGMSKVGVTAMARIQQRAFDKDSRPDLIVNACCPGYVDTDMTSHKGTKTIDQGAETPVMAALIPANATSPKGQFMSEKQVKPWQ